MPYRLVLVVVLLGLLSGRPARASETAPGLEIVELRHAAEEELAKLIAGLRPDDRRRLTGLYLAIDPDPADPSAMVACDDDGDFVVVITDAMLRLVATVARAQGVEDRDPRQAGAIEAYAAIVARAQVPGRRLLPPPPGFYGDRAQGPLEETRLREALAFVLARELAHLRAGDLACAHPTATRERGDEVWTPNEQASALVAAARVYPGRSAERDAEATIAVLELEPATRDRERGALGLLRFFERFEQERARGAASAPAFSTYVAFHPGSKDRAATVRDAARTRNQR